MSLKRETERASDEGRRKSVTILNLSSNFKCTQGIEKLQVLVLKETVTGLELLTAKKVNTVRKHALW